MASPGAWQKQKPQTHPCLSCYRPRLEKGGYCARCEESGAAERHRVFTGSAPAAPSRRAAATRPPAVVREKSEASIRTTSAAVPVGGRRRVPRRKTGNQCDPRAAANRSTAIGVPVSEQRPARDAAMRLMALPGVAVTVHVYADPKRVKAAIWYLRHRCDLPPGFRFWRDGSSVIGVYEPPRDGVG